MVDRIKGASTNQLASQKIASAKLESGEKLLWCGQPDAYKAALELLPLFLIGIMFFAIGMLFVVVGLSAGTKFMAALIFGVPVSLLMLLVLSSPVFVFLQAKKTIYALSDKRLLIIDNGRAQTAEAYDLKNLAGVTRVAWGVKGDLIWELVDAPMQLLARGDSHAPSAGAMGHGTVKLAGIESPRAVEHLIMAQLLRLREGAQK